MSKKELAFWGGLATVVGAATAGNRKWQPVHIAAVIVGALVTVAGVL